MQKKIKIWILTFSMGCLVGCSSLKTTEEKNETSQHVKTAKINAQLGMAYLEMNNIPRAKQKLLLAIQQAPTSPEPWYSMAYLLETTGNIEEADRHYMKAITIAPKRGDAHNNYGTFLCRRGKYALSIQHFLQAVKDPTYLNAADAYENAGLCAMKNKNPQQAIHFFKSALAQESDRQVSLLKLVEANYSLGHKAEAKHHLKAFSKVAPQTTQTALLTAKFAEKLA